jgi:hypothetical protein
MVKLELKDGVQQQMLKIKNEQQLEQMFLVKQRQQSQQ